MKTALVTGANRGLGLEFTRQLANKGYRVIATARNPKTSEALNELANMNEAIEVVALDVTDGSSIEGLSQTYSDTAIDLIIANSGTSGEKGVTIGNIEKENFMNVMATNCFGVVKTADCFLSQLEQSEDKTILVVSSRMGSISDNDSGRSYAYRASKTAVNSVMHSFAIDVKDRGIKVMLIHPGWVKTDMGGDNGLVDVTDSVTGMLTELDKHGASSHGEVLRRFDGGTIAW